MSYPCASIAIAMVLAVYMPPQAPALGQACRSISSNISMAEASESTASGPQIPVVIGTVSLVAGRDVDLSADTSLGNHLEHSATVYHDEGTITDGLQP